MKTQLESLPLVHRGKVRDIYAVGEDRLLIIQTDRISAFDVVLEDPVMDKGKVLTAMSNFWFDRFSHLMPNHMTDVDPLSVVAPGEADQVRDRAIVVRKFKPLGIEAIVRAYLIGTSWQEYQKAGTVSGTVLPEGIPKAGKLPGIMFTPSIKAKVGEHDENITFEEAEKLLGTDVANRVRELSVLLYTEAARYAREKGIIIADTKFEFGVDEGGTIHLIDEILTPDSSRFWPVDRYREGISPPSFDKQFVRDWLEVQPWDRKAPAPRLPADIAEKTARKYIEAWHLLTK